MSIVELLKLSEDAQKRSDWKASESINIQLLQLLGKNDDGSKSDLVTISKRYIGSILGPGLFLIDSNHQDAKTFIEKASAFSQLIKESRNLYTKLSDVEKELSEIQLFILSPKANLRNKAANSLRRLGRPDLSIQLCDHTLKESRLNYYVRIVRSWSLGDLYRIDEAISDAEVALKHQVDKRANYPQVALSRAYRLRFRRDGDVEDARKAIFWGEKAFEVNRNFYAAQQLYWSLKVASFEREDSVIHQLQREFPRITNMADEDAVSIASKVLTQSISDNLLFSEDIEPFVEDEFEVEQEESLEPSDFYEDYFPDHIASLESPRSPHLEP